MGAVRIQQKVFALTALSIRNSSIGAQDRDHRAHRPGPVDFDPLDCLSSGKAASECTYKMQANPTPIECCTGRSPTTGACSPWMPTGWCAPQTDLRPDRARHDREAVMVRT